MLNTKRVSAKPKQYKMMLKTAYAGFAELTRRDISEMRYALQHGAHATDVKTPNVNEPAIPALSLGETDLRENE